MGTYTGIGVMSGTSLDGLDIVCCEFNAQSDKYEYTIQTRKHVPYEDKWRARLSHLMIQSAEVFAKTHIYYGHWLGRIIKEFIVENRIEPDFVSVHGHTIFHQPDKNFTSQIGDGETIAAYLRCPVITNFRSKDVAIGGQGAPLVPLGEKYLFPGVDIFLNLGGFCNVSIGAIAFDIAPCNNMLNLLAKEYNSEWEYDPEGEMAASGTLSPPLLEELNDLAFYHQKPPKSLGWEWVSEHIIPIFRQSDLSLQDMAHTVVIHIADQIASALEKYSESGNSILISGGGRHNTFLMNQITSRLTNQGIIIEKVEQDIVDYKEAIVFAFLGLRVMEGKTTILSSATGAKKDILTGAIHLPASGGYLINKRYS